MRPVVRLAAIIIIFLTVQVGLVQMSYRVNADRSDAERMMNGIVGYLGLSDLCVATDARYIRNPAIADRVVPYMDHPGALEHFPTGSFWAAER